MSGGLTRCMVLLVLITLVQWAGKQCEGRTVEMQMIYRYSEEFRAMRGGQMVPSDWPKRGEVAAIDWRTGSLEQHEHLMARDRMRRTVRHGRKLAGASSLSPTNETFNIDVLGGLHYAFITLGTPNLTFLVALDTGSDLLWVPCNCQQCSSTDWASYGLQRQGLDFAVYNQASSSTSKFVSCTNSVCSPSLNPSTCSSSDDKCSYLVKYMSTGTSTAGVIVEDLLYLNYEASTGGSTSTPIYFGCGQLQTGDLVEGVAPNGLLGLGPDQISVPSTLARNGVVSANSFSMCFSSSDSSGRLFFGSEAPNSLPSTPLLPVTPSVYYVIGSTKFSFGGDSISAAETLIFDTGTSYTTLPQSSYQSLGNMMNKQISLPQFQLNGTFDYCWNTSDQTILSSLPTLSITFSGGNTWDIINPVVTFVNREGVLQFFCLGITPSSNAIIGHNFMGGYEFFFNQDLMTFSWSPSTCYNINASTAGGPQKEPSSVNRASKESSSSHSQRIALYNGFMPSLHLLLFLVTLILFI